MFSAVILGFASIVAAQQYTKSPTAPAPAGCTGTYSGSFEVGITQLDAASKLKRQSQPSIANALVITLLDGVLTDNTGRNGYIAANEQFQFDANGGQTGTKYNSGFSVCANNTLALGGSAIWWECLSGDFYNIYDSDWAPQCKPAYLNVVTYTGTASASVTGAAAAQTDIASTSATATGSGSVSVSTSVIVSTSSAADVSSIGDGQIQGPTTTSSVVVTSTTSSLVTITPTPSSTTTVGPVLTSITDHQIQAPTTTASVTPYTGAAAMPTAAAGLLLAAAGAAVALL